MRAAPRLLALFAQGDAVRAHCDSSTRSAHGLAFSSVCRPAMRSGSRSSERTVPLILAKIRASRLPLVYAVWVPPQLAFGSPAPLDCGPAPPRSTNRLVAPVY